MMVVPTINLKGFKIHNGTAYAIVAQISLTGPPEQVRLQIEDGYRRLKGLKLIEMKWQIAERHLQLFKDALRASHVSPTVEDVESRSFYGLNIQVLRGPEHRDPSKGPGRPPALRRHHLRG